MNKFIKTFLITAFLTFSMVLSVFAEVPGFTITMGDKTFDLDYLNMSEQLQVIKNSSDKGNINFTIKTYDGSYKGILNSSNQIESENFISNINSNENFITEDTTIIEDNNYFITSVNEATFGSIVNVQFTDKGKTAFPDGVKYQLYINNIAQTAKANLAVSTTIFPSKVPGDVVDVMLYNANDEELKLVTNVVLGGIVIEKCTISGTISLPYGETAPEGGIDVKIYPIKININDTIQWLDCSYVKIEAGENSASYSIKLNPNANYIINYQMDDKSLNYVQRGFYGVTGIEYNTFNASPINVTDQDIININMKMEPSKDIRGTISLPEGRYAPEGGMQVLLSSWINLNDNNGLIDFKNFKIEEGKIL